jgi:photosystem II stability/assembly factor-like uncharacterized protein
MITRRLFFAWLAGSIAVLLLAACSLVNSLPVITATLTSPAATLAPLPPTVTPTQPLSTIITPSDTPQPEPPEYIQDTPVLDALGPAIRHLKSGQKIDITYIHMQDANQGWGIGGLSQASDHVFRTQDGGNTWHDVTPPQPAPAPGDAVAALGYFKDASTGWVAYGPPADSSGVPPFMLVWSTQNGGSSWTYSAIDTSSANAVVFSPKYMEFTDNQNGRLMVVLGGGMMHEYVVIYATHDGGATWTDLPDSLWASGDDIQSFAKTGMVFVDSQNGWLTRDAQGVDSAPHVFYTSDGGMTWTRIDLPAPAGTTGWFDNNACGMYYPFVLSPASAIFAMKCLDTSTYKIQHDYLYSTGDGGHTWQSSPLPADFTIPDLGGALYFSDAQTGFAFGRRIYRTSNGGQTWTFVQQVYWDGQFSVVSPSLVWAAVVSYDASFNKQVALVKTIDGGATWALLKPIVAP